MAGSKFQAGSYGANIVARKLRRMGYRATDMRPAWPAVSRRAVEGYRKSFDAEGPGWKPLSNERVRQRIRDGIEGAHPILNATGKMREEVMSPDMDSGPTFVELLVSSDILYFHQSGTKRMPQRPIHLRRRDGTFMSMEVQRELLEAYRLG